MHIIYSTCLLSVLSIGYTQVKAFPTQNEVQCGTVKRRSAKIINGQVAEDAQQIPWIASLKLKGMHFCGGTIVSSRFILSAAHCMDAYLETRRGHIVDARFHPQLDNYSVTLGEYDLTEDESQSVSYGIKTIIFHKKYRRFPVANDIVLIELDSEIEWTDHIQPICLPKEDIRESDKALAAGWGDDSFLDPEENNKLRFIELIIFNNDRCNDIYSKRNLGIQIDETQMCAGKLDEIRDTNEGDSGGPLLVNRNGREIIVGLTSSGTPESIFPKAPGRYTRIYQYLDWILDYTQESKTYFAVLHNQI